MPARHENNDNKQTPNTGTIHVLIRFLLLVLVLTSLMLKRMSTLLTIALSNGNSMHFVYTALGDVMPFNKRKRQSNAAHAAQMQGGVASPKPQAQESAHLTPWPHKVRPRVPCTARFCPACAPGV